MARIRTIKPSAFSSEDFCALSPLARVFFFALLCEADRLGRLEFSQGNLRLRYLPSDPKADIESMITEMEQRNMVRRYEHEGREYLLIVNFLKHQRPNNKEPESLLPIPVALRELEATLVEGKGRGIGREVKATAPDLAIGDAASFFDAWNALAEERGFAKVSKLSDQRKRKLLARLKDRHFNFDTLSKWVRVSQGLGQWFTFDWILSEGNYLKLTEGNYVKAFGEKPHEESAVEYHAKSAVRAEAGNPATEYLPEPEYAPSDTESLDDPSSDIPF